MAVVGFPLDSRVTGFDENGLPTYTNKYHSTDYRKMLAALVSNGVISDGGSELKVVPANQNAMSNQTVAVKINDGSAVLDGAFVTLESETLNVTAPTNIDPQNIGSIYRYVIIRVETLDNGDNDEEASVELVGGAPKYENGTPNDPVVTGRYLVLAKILSKTVKNSDGTYTYSHQIQDTRSSSLCGFAAPFTNVDLSAVNEAIAEMEHQTQVAVQVSQNALDGTTAGNLTQRVAALEADSGWVVPSSSNPNTKYKTIGKTLSLILNQSVTFSNAAIDSYATVFTLPSGARPKASCYCVGLLQTSSALLVTQVNIDTGGNVSVRNAAASAGTFTIRGTFTVLM